MSVFIRCVLPYRIILLYSNQRVFVPMKIEIDVPPNFKDIVKVFPHAADKGVLFCWNDIIFNPSGFAVGPSIVAHEKVHSKRQDGKAEDWWAKYLIDTEFRLKEELLAHTMEFLVASEGQTRHNRRGNLVVVSKKLSSPLYGGMVSYNEAKELIKEFEYDEIREYK